MQQGELFSGFPSMPEVERQRLSRQCREILERLQRGPASSAELNRIAFRYSARIHELRKAGYEIRLTDHDHESGVTWYALGYKKQSGTVA